jgi:hypothetical protein
MKEQHENAPNAWNAAAPLLQELDKHSNEGVTAIVKIDGERESQKYTVVLSGGQLGERFFRQDGDCLPTLLELAIDFYNRPDDHQSQN